MHRHVTVAHAVEQDQHRVVGQVLALVTGECPFRSRMLVPYRPQDLDRPVWQRNAMLPLALDASGWDGPDLAVQVELCPLGADRLDGPGSIEDRELQAAGRHPFPL